MPRFTMKNGRPFIDDKPVHRGGSKFNGMSVYYVISDIVEITGAQHEAKGGVYFTDDDNNVLFFVSVTSDIAHGFLDIDYIVRD